jgi:hypothetical protein
MFVLDRCQGDRRLSASREAVPPASARGRSIGARRAARLAKAGRVAGLASRGASAAGIAEREGVTVERIRPKTVPQELENIRSAPGDAMALEASNPHDLAPCFGAQGTTKKAFKVAGFGA